MAELTLLKVRAAEERHSPELRYTFERCVAEARAVFDGVEVVFVGEALDEKDRGRLPVPTTPWVLLMGIPCILIARASLAAMRAAVETGAPAARPCRLAETSLPQRFPLYTLRGFERAEAALLAEELITIDASPASPLPISLWQDSAFAAFCAGQAVEGMARVGLYHQFSDYYGEPRRDVLPLIPDTVRDVLEIGCGRGITGELLRQRGCRVVGVEMNPEIARQAAERLDRVLVGDVQRLEIDGRFDLVLALELFEHLTDGEAFLERARGWLRPGGSILLSVPNVGHFAVVEDLLAGRWDYLPQGLLCYTHYRFFTRATLEDWLRRCGFERFEIVPQKTPLPDDLPAAFEAGGFAVDRDSLATAGFYVRVEGVRGEG